jgi:hypothetical protein
VQHPYLAARAGVKEVPIEVALAGHAERDARLRRSGRTAGAAFAAPARAEPIVMIARDAAAAAYNARVSRLDIFNPIACDPGPDTRCGR